MTNKNYTGQKKIALKNLGADHIACYGKLLKYAHILMKMNRGACVKVKG